MKKAIVSLVALSFCCGVVSACGSLERTSANSDVDGIYAAFVVIDERPLNETMQALFFCDSQEDCAATGVRPEIWNVSTRGLGEGRLAIGVVFHEELSEQQRSGAFDEMAQ